MTDPDKGDCSFSGVFHIADVMIAAALYSHKGLLLIFILPFSSLDIYILSLCKLLITKTRLFKYIENFTSKNLKKKSDKNPDIFYISAQNIDCGYSLEPPRRGGSNEYPQSMFSSKTKKTNVYPCKPQFYYIKVGFKGVNII